jgi:predicted methyltransferase
LTENSNSKGTHPVFSYFQTAQLLQAKRDGRPSALASIDLGISSVEAILHPDNVTFPGGVALTWDQIAEIDADRDSCFYLCDNTLHPIRGYSGLTRRSFSLMPTSDAPSMIIAGFTMHRIKNITPLSAAKQMVETIAPFRGQVLDTATGLGYTAIAAAKSAARVITIEFDPTAQEMARYNPWSRELFDNPKITQLMGDSATEIERFSSGSFSAILHDPPSMSIAGDLYSGEFYRHAFRILAPRGKMFHYIGDPESGMGARVTTGVIKRLKEAGFAKVVRSPKAFGVVAYK